MIFIPIKIYFTYNARGKNKHGLSLIITLQGVMSICFSLISRVAGSLFSF